jgi:hypothetical protein
VEDDLTVLFLGIRDRVERLDGSGESRWGTITGRQDDDWLVLDNAGHTHRDSKPNLRRATRAVARP